jgi:hypothetical protein
MPVLICVTAKSLMPYSARAFATSFTMKSSFLISRFIYLTCSDLTPCFQDALALQEGAPVTTGALQRLPDGRNSAMPPAGVTHAINSGFALADSLFPYTQCSCAIQD